MKSAIRNSASIIGLVIILIISLYSISDATSNSEVFEKYYDWLVFFNVIAVIALVLLIAYNLYKLIVQYRLKQVGSRLTARMLFIFGILTLIPVSIVYYFSLTFIHRSIDSWFDVGIEQALEDSLELSKSALDVRKREALKKTQNIADNISSVDENLMIVYLNDVRSNLAMNELTLIGNNKSIIASSSDNSAELPIALSFPEVGELALGNHYLAFESIEELGLQIRVIIPVLSSTASTKTWQLHAFYPLTDQINELSAGVETAFEKYKELSVLREPLKNSFSLALSVIWLLSVLSAIWVAFIAAKRLVAPINDLVEGTKAVAAGDYERQVPLSGTDELGFLLKSFNSMTRKILLSKQLVEKTQLLEAVQRAYLESVLEHISSGVLTLDHHLLIKKVNSAAGSILDVDESQCNDYSIDDIIAKVPFLQPLLSEILLQIKKEQASWQKEMVFFGKSGRKVLQLRGVAFSEENASLLGHVVVIDDLTDMIHAQKNTAWSEMARRLAHEIKNPLTPIQLSAERLKRKLAPVVSNENNEMLNRYTDTIVQQVDAMKVMVNSFTDYARSSETTDVIDFNQMICNVAALYEPQADKLELDLDDKLANIQGDSVRLRQVLHNLIKNAVEAHSSKAHVEIKTSMLKHLGSEYIDITFKDYGQGIQDDLIDQIFDPYITSKASGTGLGLAIVKKIVEEHSGIVWVENNEQQGVSFFLRFPVINELKQ